MKIAIISTVLLTLIVSWTGKAKAYSVEHIHPHLTEIALDIYRDCTGHSLTSVFRNKTEFENAKQNIKQANIEEDDGHYITRAFNWHFYNTELKNNGIGIETFDDTFQKLVTALNNKASSRKEAYKIIGRIFHYIEDVTVPAHVIPVYHSINQPWLTKHIKWQWVILVTYLKIQMELVQSGHLL